MHFWKTICLPNIKVLRVPLPIKLAKTHSVLFGRQVSLTGLPRKPLGASPGSPHPVPLQAVLHTAARADLGSWDLSGPSHPL